MAKRSIGITTVGYGFSSIYGLGLAIYLGGFALSFFNPDAVLNSSFFAGKFHNISEFRWYSVILWLALFPQFIGFLAVLWLKEWARRLVIAMNVLLLFCSLYQVIFKPAQPDIRSLAPLLIYVALILFFSWPKIKGQFQQAVSHLKKILIIDDDKGLLKMMKVSLTARGFDILTAATGEKGLVVAARKKPDLIILDVILPGIKGREVCVRLKGDSQTKDIPVVFLTAKSSPDDIQAELAAGAISHITKPLDSHKVLTEINKLLGS